MRAFIAIELPPEIKHFLAELQEQLRSSGADVKWVKPQNIHLTLKFLGDINEEKLAQIKCILEDITKDKNSYSLRLSCLGAFPKINSPRVIWIGIDKGVDETEEIVKALEEKIAKLGIPKENRPFTCHITIGRVRLSLNRQNLVQSLINLENKSGQETLEFKVKKITLIKSVLTPKGPLYEVLKEANLKTT